MGIRRKPMEKENNPYPMRIKMFRVTRHLTQDAFAEQIGSTKQAVSLWEHGKTQPNLASLQKIVDTFGIETLKEIFTE